MCVKAAVAGIHNEWDQQGSVFTFFVLDYFALEYFTQASKEDWATTLPGRK